VYALDADGALLWRFPDQGSAPAGFWAPLALSPDGEVAYAGSGWAPEADPLDRSVPGTLIALDLGAAVEEGAAPVAWRLELVDAGAIATPPVWPTRLAVGVDGAVFVGGRAPFALGPDGGAAVVGRVEDLGDEGRVGWSSWVTLDPGGASWVPALALRERNGQTERVIAAAGGERAGGAHASVGWIEALHPDTGAPLWDAPFDPSAFGRAGAPSGLAIGADGLVYAAITGRAAGGAVVAISESGGLVWEAAVAGLLEGGAPAIGPDGTLYVGDARPCALSWAPIELGLCDANRVDPEVYAFREAGAVDPIAFPEASACEGCAAGGGSGAAWLGLIALGWTRRRRR
jgi:uncharacterized protein (TIGR03382 family)